jgi:hypothetical protein
VAIILEHECASISPNFFVGDESSSLEVAVIGRCRLNMNGSPIFAIGAGYLHK